ncbi:MAG: N-acetylmuramoyl-L-alanine amidase, partial [Oscillospiraceae bacterium]|nr:N-acetylmuramoyl-L-alanine amidase [Oscillospiraceae bacterium]
MRIYRCFINLFCRFIHFRNSSRIGLVLIFFRVFLLSRIHCPGILVECGFLSNPLEERLLQTE